MAFHVKCASGVPKRQFAAKYASKCEICSLEMKPGELISWNRNSSKGGESPPTPGDTSAHETNFVEAFNKAIKGDEKKMGSGMINVELLAQEMLPYLEGKIKGGGTSPVTRVEIVTPQAPIPNDVGVQHKQFPTLLKTLASRVDTWLAGPSGSGKTTAVHAAAKALNLTFRSCGALQDVYALKGYNDAQGRYVRTLYRETYEHGGVMLLDEFDGSDPSVGVALNQDLANGHAAFPDTMVERHPDAVFAIGANTWGHGGTHEYVGRLKQDAAFLKRFANLDWGYDWDLIEATAANPKWAKRVLEVHKKVVSKGLRVLVTPREVAIGARLLAQGIEQKQVEEMTLRSGMTQEQWDSVR